MSINSHGWVCIQVHKYSKKLHTVLARVDSKGREESIKCAIWPVHDVFGKSRVRNSNTDQSERLLMRA